jgi:hypothetical protein
VFSDFRGKRLIVKGSNPETNPEGHRISEILIFDILQEIKNNINKQIPEQDRAVKKLEIWTSQLTSLYENYINTLENFMNNLESKNQRHHNFNNFIKESLEYMFYEAIKEHLEYIKNEIATAPIGASQ